MRTSKQIAAALGLVVLAGCGDFNVPDLNNPGLGELTTNPTRAGILTASTGLLIGSRGGMGSQNGYVSVLGVFGRESYNFDPADPRFVTELLIGPLDGGSPAFGGNLWGGAYANIRNADIVLAAVTAIVTDPISGLTTAEKEALRGFAKTLKALDLLQVINTRDSNGAVITVPTAPTDPPGAIESRANVFNYIVALLDSADTHLAAGGTAFPHQMSAGYAGFDTPPTFRPFNRALRARVAAYLADWNGVLTAIGAAGAFAGSGAPLTQGVYHSFGSGSGDVQNALFDPQARAILAHPSLRTDAQLRAGGGRDLRFENKTDSTPPHSAQGVASDLLFTIYNSPNDPVPIIRTEELILLRAEANIQLNNLAAAAVDLDSIRIRSGGLAAYAGTVSQPALTDELLYNRRYSLMFEGGHRWIDMRRYNRLTQLPQALPSHTRFPRMPFPTAECDPRPTPPAGCGTQVGL